MFADPFRRARKAIRDGRRHRATTRVETLESRQLLTYSPIGSLPQIQVSGQAGPIAAYGGPITVTLDITNTGASSVVEPLALAPGSTSTADAAPGRIGVFLLPNPHARPGSRGTVFVGDVGTPEVPQNSLVRVTETLTLPNRPRRFPGSGGKVFLGFRPMGSLRRRNGGAAVPVIINAGLPDLAAINIDLPQTVQPGDVIAPAIKIANYGTVNTNTQGPVTVLLVASTDKNYGPTDIILAQYQITSLPGLSEAPSRRVVLGDVNIDNPPNVITLDASTVGATIAQVPFGSTYYIGVVVDPLNEIRELNEIGQGPDPSLRLVKQVNNVPGLPPALVLSDPAPVGNDFVIPPFGPTTTLADFLTTPLQGSSPTIIVRTAGVHTRSRNGRGRGQ